MISKSGNKAVSCTADCLWNSNAFVLMKFSKQLKAYSSVKLYLVLKIDKNYFSPYIRDLEHSIGYA